MMRRLVIVGLLATLGACKTETPIGPEATSVINVRVRDDIGAPVDRTHIIVTMSATRLDSRTGRDGTADIDVGDAGVYMVRVVPRAGYVGEAQPIMKTVRVDSNTIATVDFTLNRAGTTSPNSPTPIEQ